MTELNLPPTVVDQANKGICYKSVLQSIMATSIGHEVVVESGRPMAFSWLY